MTTITNHSLYRYPGGKNRMKKDLQKIIMEVKPDLNFMVSPFLGGGSLELLMAGSNGSLWEDRIKVQAYDIFKPLADFWEILKEEGGVRIAAEVRKHMPLTHNDEYKAFLPNLDSDDKFTRAWSFYICIKASYSGMIGSTTERARAELREAGLEKLERFENPYFFMEWGDCFETIQKHNKDFMYLDPPYYKTVNHYYGKKGELHKAFNHEKYCEILKEHKGGFVMSYDNSDKVKELYKDWTEFRYLTFPYQMSGKKRYNKEELVIIKYPTL